MITEEEKQEIIDRAVEKALLMLPDTVGSLMAQQATYARLNSQFYKDHPEFVNHKEVVASVIEKVDGENPTIKYEEKLKKAEPLIRERIAMLDTLDMKEAKQPSRDFKTIDIGTGGNGEL